MREETSVRDAMVSRRRLICGAEKPRVEEEGTW